MKKICIVGSTGSIGTQSLAVMRENKNDFEVCGLAARHKIQLLEEQILEFNPRYVYIKSKEDAKSLSAKYDKQNVYFGENGIEELLDNCQCDTVINALVGIKGLVPTLKAIKNGMDIALANKETLVVGGSLVMDKARKKGVKIYPVDSEHSAIFQSLQGNDRKSVKKVILTASGGPFRNFTIEQLKRVTAKDALNHPNWIMGKKITVDSATLMNKGLEVIEAKWLFDLNDDQIEVVVHPQSILHSAVEYEDGAIIGQMGKPDMKLPIAYALTYPKRKKLKNTQMSRLWEIGSMTFESVDMSRFPCVRLAFEAMKKGGSFPVVLNSANEVLVDEFLKGTISFLDISKYVEKALYTHDYKEELSLDEILELDEKTRQKVYEYVGV